MVFFVSVAADIFGRKHNVRLEFATCPTITELINAAESNYDITARATRPSNYPDVPFRIQSFQVYDDVMLRWVDLYSSAQLTSGCQVYSFQPETIWNVDLQGTIPVARDTVTWSTYTGSPRRAVLARDAGLAASMSEKLRSVFYDLDSGNKGYILYSDLRAAFLRLDVEFSYTTVGELFNIADRNRDGQVSYEEWVRFSIDHPNIIDALFFRTRDLLTTRQPVYVPTTEEIISQRRIRELELDRLFRESQLSTERSRLQREYDDAKREAELSRARAQAAADKERQILDRLYLTPGSPRFGYR